MSGDEISERFIVGIESFVSLGSAFLRTVTGRHTPPLSSPAICHLYGSDTPITEFFLETNITTEDDVCVASDWLGKISRRGQIPSQCDCVILLAPEHQLTVSILLVTFLCISPFDSVSCNSCISLLVLFVGMGARGAKVSRRTKSEARQEILSSTRPAYPPRHVRMVCLAYTISTTMVME